MNVVEIEHFNKKIIYVIFKGVELKIKGYLKDFDGQRDNI